MRAFVRVIKPFKYYNLYDEKGVLLEFIFKDHFEDNLSIISREKIKEHRSKSESFKEIPLSTYYKLKKLVTC